MKARIALSVVVALALACSMAVVVSAAQEAAKVAGKWEMSSEGPQGPVTRNMTIEQDGEKIKVKIASPRGETEYNGTVKGNNISFSMTRQTPNGEMTIEYKGTVDGDNMKGTVTSPMGSREWTAKRVKE